MSEHELRAHLARIAEWGDRRLDSESADRQRIAEYLTTATAALADGQTPPAPPF